MKKMTGKIKYIRKRKKKKKEWIKDREKMRKRKK